MTHRALLSLSTLFLLILCHCGGGAVPQPPSVPAPEPKPDTWTVTGGPLGGLGYDVRMRVDAPDTLFVTDAWAGVFTSTDGGAHWAATNAGITVRGGRSGDAIPIFCLTIDPHDDDTVWAGTQNKRGIFRSVDGGATWHERDHGVLEDGITFRGITVDPTTPDIVYAAAELSSWVWAGKEILGREFDKTKGVVYKTTDAGLNWFPVWDGDNLARYVWIDPRDPNVIYIATGIFDREAANSAEGGPDVLDTPGGEGVLKSTDGGQTWLPANTGLTNLYVGSLYMHPTDPDVLLAGAGNNAYPDGSGIFLTTNGAASWTKVWADDIITAVEFCESDPDVAYAGSRRAIYRSTNAGLTWSPVTPEPDTWGAPGVQAGFPIDFQADPRNAQRVFANNYGGGNFLSTDGGVTWTVASTGYTGAQVRAIATDPVMPGRIYAAARSGIFATSDGGRNWEGLGFAPATGLEWTAVAVDPFVEPHVLAANNWLRSIVRSSDGGQSWQTTGQSALVQGFGWSALAFASSDSTFVYAGTGAFRSAGGFDLSLPAKGIYRSTNQGADWSPANDATSLDAHVTALVIDPSTPQTVFAATTNRGVLKTVDGGQTWIKRNTGLPASPKVRSIAAHPNGTGVWFAGLWGGGLYKSLDGATTWTQVSAGLAPEVTVTDIIFHPTDAQTLYFATHQSGVHRSHDGGQTWNLLNDGLRTRDVTDLDFSANGHHLYAATEGEGVFRLDLSGVPPVEH